MNLDKDCFVENKEYGFPCCQTYVTVIKRQETKLADERADKLLNMQSVLVDMLKK